MGPEEFPIVNLKDIIKTFYPRNALVENYIQNNESNFCFGILESDFGGIGDSYAD